MDISKLSLRFSTIALLSLAASLAGCGSELATPETSLPTGGAQASSGGTASATGDPLPMATDLFAPAVSKVIFEVDYATGDEPFTGQQLILGDVWSIFKTNAERVFLNAPKELTIPTEVSAMEELADVMGADFTTDQILAIADKHRGSLPTADTATFYFVWLPGYYNDGTMVRKDVLGVSIGDTHVIAMFKEPIKATSSLPGLDTATPTYVEQATLVHEFGHAIGLVDNGIPTTSDHLDKDHKAHCSNTDCVMYYAIDGSSGAASYVQKYLTKTASVLYGQECLDDIDAAAKAANSP